MKRPALLAVTAATLAAAALPLVGPLVAPQTTASSHREAPVIAQDPVADGTDFYMFVSPDRPDTVTFIANYLPLEIPGSGPNFYRFGDDVLYEVHIDNDGDALPNITYGWRFQTTIQNPNTFNYNTGPITSLDDPDFNLRQSYTLTRTDSQGTTTLVDNAPVPPVNVGPKSTPNYGSLAAAAVTSLPNGGMVFAGQRDDPFFLDLGATFDLLTIRPGPPGGLSTGGVDGLRNLSVQTLALQVPIGSVTSDGSNPNSLDAPSAVIGAWTTSSRQNIAIQPDGTRSGTGSFTQVSRLGNPLVNEFNPIGAKDLFNASQPRNDEQFLSAVTNPELPKLLNALYGVPVPEAPRNDLVTVFLTGIPGVNQPANVTPSEMMRLNVAVPPTANPNRLGVLAGDMGGFPNGRRLGDDVVDAALRVMAGVLVPGFDMAPNNVLGDGVQTNDKPFLGTFPYVALPLAGFDWAGGAQVSGDGAQTASPQPASPIRPLDPLPSARPSKSKSPAQLWVRGYPEIGPSGCVDYVAQWSDGSYSGTPWDCGEGTIARRGDLTATRGYPQVADNRCVEYVTQWSDGSYTWVPFECPPGVTYFKPY